MDKRGVLTPYAKPHVKNRDVTRANAYAHRAVDSSVPVDSGRQVASAGATIINLPVVPTTVIVVRFSVLQTSSYATIYPGRWVRQMYVWLVECGTGDSVTGYKRGAALRLTTICTHDSLLNDPSRDASVSGR